MTHRTKVWMVGLGSIPALLALPWVLVMVVYGIQSGLLGNSYPMGMVMLAAVVGMFVAFVFLPFVVLLKWGAGALGRAKKILFWVLLFDVLAIPVVMLIVKIATPKVYDRESLALVAMEAPEVDVSGIWVGEWTDPRKEMTSKITLTLTQTGGSVTGVIDDDRGKRWEIVEGVVSGAEVNFFYDRAFASGPGLGATLLGEVEGDTISGDYFGHERPRPGWASTGPWRATRRR